MARDMLRLLLRSQQGLTTIEYALLLLLLVVAGFLAWSAFGGQVVTMVEEGATSF